MIEENQTEWTSDGFILTNTSQAGGRLRKPWQLNVSLCASRRREPCHIVITSLDVLEFQQVDWKHRVEMTFADLNKYGWRVVLHENNEIATQIDDGSLTLL